MPSKSSAVVCRRRSLVEITLVGASLIGCQNILGIEGWEPKANGNDAGPSAGGAPSDGGGGGAGDSGGSTGDAGPCEAEYCVTELAAPTVCGGDCQGSCSGECSVTDAAGDCLGLCQGDCDGTCIEFGVSVCQGTRVCSGIVGAYGDPCSDAGTGACFMSDLPVSCDGARWTAAARCADGTACDTTPGSGAGTCRPIVPECAGRTSGEVVCRGLQRAACSMDRLSTELVDVCVAGSEVCLDGACMECPARRGDCDGDAVSCETDLDDVGTCGVTCGDVLLCSSSNGTAACAAGVCTTSSCDAGYADCGGVNDGCETNLDSPATCGTSCQNVVACSWPTPACVAGSCVSPPSCSGLAADCGASANESCCESELVAGGLFNRSFDGTTVGHLDRGFPATVGDFRLDRFEVTVGRLRKFQAAWQGGWRPAPGAGKHIHLNQGSGLEESSGASPNEAGWNPVWISDVALTSSSLGCFLGTWTDAVGANEKLPVNCLNWYEAYAFCTWDGGFLPSEAEWNYAAAGGDEQRAYPWSSPASSTSIDDTRAAYCGGSCTATQVVGSKPAGAGKYGHADLGGNLSEWNLDANAGYPVPCDDCSFAPPTAPDRMVRGGAYNAGALALLASVRNFSDPTNRIHFIGVRCARTP